PGRRGRREVGGNRLERLGLRRELEFAARMAVAERRELSILDLEPPLVVLSSHPPGRLAVSFRSDEPVTDLHQLLDVRECMSAADAITKLALEIGNHLLLSHNSPPRPWYWPESPSLPSCPWRLRRDRR